MGEKVIDVEVGNVVQVAITSKNEAFRGCLLIVDEIRSWGVTCYCRIPGEEGVAYLRLPFSDCLKVGPAPLTMSQHQLGVARSAMASVDQKVMNRDVFVGELGDDPTAREAFLSDTPHEQFSEPDAAPEPGFGPGDPPASPSGRPPSSRRSSGR